MDQASHLVQMFWARSLQVPFMENCLQAVFYFLSWRCCYFSIIAKWFKKIVENSGLSQALIAAVPPMNPGTCGISLGLYVKLEDIWNSSVIDEWFKKILKNPGPSQSLIALVLPMNSCVLLDTYVKLAGQWFGYKPHSALHNLCLERSLYTFLSKGSSSQQGGKIAPCSVNPIKSEMPFPECAQVLPVHPHSICNHDHLYTSAGDSALIEPPWAHHQTLGKAIMTGTNTHWPIPGCWNMQYYGRMSNPCLSGSSFLGETPL